MKRIISLLLAVAMIACASVAFAKPKTKEEAIAEANRRTNEIIRNMGGTNSFLDFSYSGSSNNAYIPTPKPSPTPVPAECEEKYQKALALEKEGEYLEALDEYSYLRWKYKYKDSEEREYACKEKLYPKALALETEGKYSEAQQIFHALGDYKDSKDHYEVCKKAAEKIAHDLTYGEQDEYMRALSLEGKGEYAEALEIYESLNGYKLSEKRIKICKEALGLTDTPTEEEPAAPETPVEAAKPAEYSVFAFSEGFFQVCNEDTGKWGFIDKDGNLAIPCEWSVVNNFTDGFALVADDEDNWGYIDTKGNEVVPVKYEKSKISYGGGYFAIVEDGEITVISAKKMKP